MRRAAAVALLLPSQDGEDIRAAQRPEPLCPLQVAGCARAVRFVTVARFTMVSDPQGLKWTHNSGDLDRSMHRAYVIGVLRGTV